MILDTTLLEHEASLRPIRVGMVGAGATGCAIALQLATPALGVCLAAICNRTPEHRKRAFREAGMTDWQFGETAREAETCIAPAFQYSPMIRLYLLPVKLSNA